MVKGNFGGYAVYNYSNNCSGVVYLQNLLTKRSTLAQQVGLDGHYSGLFGVTHFATMYTIKPT